MFNWIPIQFYTPLYHHLLLIVVLVTFINTYISEINENRNIVFIRNIGYFLFVFVLLYMGLRPISGVFIDMTTYAQHFEKYQFGSEIISQKDTGFHMFMKLSSYIMSAQSFFLLCTVLYVVPLFIACKKWFKKYWYYVFLMLVASFSFWAYGVNGIRNGIATSLFILAISRDKIYSQIILLLVAITFHTSMLLPTIAFISTKFYNKSNLYFYFWLACIPLSLIFAGFWENLFSSFVDDERSAFFTTEASSEQFSRVGFRWDFLVYSASGVLAGWFYVLKLGVKDKFYSILFNTYLISNAFWILVIRANFSNRFAYLSWFMLAIVIFYPLAKWYFIENQHRKLGWLMLTYFGFTYLMVIVLG